MMLLLTLLLTLSTANADEFIRYSIHAKEPYPDLSSLSIGVTEQFFFLKSKYEGGIILDRRVPNKALFISAGLGVQPEYGPISLYFFQNVAFLTATDKYLSTNFQFMEDVGMVFRGKDNTFIGVGCRHISNGGIQLPNAGKDFCGLLVGFDI